MLRSNWNCILNCAHGSCLFFAFAVYVAGSIDIDALLVWYLELENSIAPGNEYFYSATDEGEEKGGGF